MNINSKLFTKENLGTYYGKVQVPDGLEEFILPEYQTKDINPAFDDIFRALQLTPLDKVKVVILGQDPYPTKDVADGLAFSVREGIKAPMSIRNMFAEINAEYGAGIPVSKDMDADLSGWAEEGVLLLNTVLTVEAGKPKSHFRKGWETVTDSIIKTICERDSFAVFLLFGNDAQKKTKLIEQYGGYVIKAVHPSPLSARRGFFDSGVFRRCDEALIQHGEIPVCWTGRKY